MITGILVNGACSGAYQVLCAYRYDHIYFFK